LARDHLTACDCFDEKYEGGDREDVVVGRERCEPGNLQIANPDYEDGDVDRE
jgi:hypothetical protein